MARSGLSSVVVRHTLCAGWAFVALVAQPALAEEQGSANTQAITQTSADEVPLAEVQEIIVTAQKRNERLSDVPISITAASGEQLAMLGINSPNDLAKIVPGFTVQRSTFGVPVFTIRGIGLYDTAIGISPTVSVYSDQVPLPYLTMTRGASLDLERVEVLKGPQGTLFGQNSTGGAINYIAAKPTYEPHLGFDLTYGRFNQADMEVFASGPILEGVRFRIAVRHESRDGWQISETRPTDRLGVRDFNTARAILDWDASDRLKIEFNANGWIDRSESQAAQFLGFVQRRPGGYPESFIAIGGLAPAPNTAQAADWDPGINYHSRDHQYQFSARADYELSKTVSITSITSDAHYRGDVPAVDTDGTDFDNFRHTTDAEISTFSEELRTAATVGGVTITVGSNYQNDRTDDADRNRFIGSNGGVGPNRFFTYANVANQQAKTYAAFANVDVPLLPTLTAQAGSRYTHQDRDFEGCLADGGDGGLAGAIALIPTFSGLPFDPAPAGGCVTLDPATRARLPIVTNSLDQSNVSWRGGLNWKPAANTLIYANVTRGFKAGAFTPLSAIFASQLTPVTQEEVTAYEAGVKTDFLDRRVSLATAIYYQDYRNKQLLGNKVFPLFGPLPQLQNIPKSSVRGGEIELTFRPTDGLRFSANAAYTHSRVDESFASFDPFGRAIDLKGEDFPNTPHWQANGDAEYDFPISPKLKGFVGGDVSYRSTSNAQFGDRQEFQMRSYALIDLRAGIGRTDDEWRLELWAHNASNTFYWTGVSYYIDTYSRTAGMPATYGMTLRVRY